MSGDEEEVGPFPDPPAEETPRDPPLAQASYYEPATGRIVGSMMAHEADIAASTPPGCGVIAGQWDAARFYVLDGEAVLRPETAEPEREGSVILFGAYPPESVVTVTNEAGDEIAFAASEGPLTLLDPGLYRLRIEPPFPHHPVAIKVEIP